MLPDIFICTDQAHVTSPVAGAENVILLHTFVPASIVTVYATGLEFTSKNTSSDDVGRSQFHGAHHEVEDQ